jgi:hypothetical protein
MPAVELQRTEPPDRRQQIGREPRQQPTRRDHHQPGPDQQALMHQTAASSPLDGNARAVWIF